MSAFMPVGYRTLNMNGIMYRVFVYCRFLQRQAGSFRDNCIAPLKEASMQVLKLYESIRKGWNMP